MAEFNFEKMQELQKELQEKYKYKWTPISPAAGREKLLWPMIEAGEMADVVKKNNDAEIMDIPEVRKQFIEEMCDTLMYLNDLMLCYGVSPKELEEVYLEKHMRNMGRW